MPVFGGAALRVVSVQRLPYSLPFLGPIQTARGSFTERRGHLMRLRCEDGREGFGEAAPWPGFGTCPSRLTTALDACIALLAEQPMPLDDIESLQRWLDRQALPPEARCALELGALDLLAQGQQTPLACLLAANAPRPRVAVCAVVSDADDARVALTQGFSALKVKVGAAPFDRDLERLQRIRDAVPAKTGLRADANGAWDAEQASRSAESLAALNLEWLEQPVPSSDVAGLGRVRAQGHVKIAADEAVATHGAAVIAQRAADVLVIKPMFVGGLLPAWRIAQQASAAGLQSVISSAWESAVGRLGCLHLAAALPVLNHACGLASPLGNDLAPGPELQSGHLTVPTCPGLGVTPDLSEGWAL